MGVDIILYRIRIGTFMQRRKKQSKSKARYSPYTSTKGNDIHYRVFASCVVITFCLFLTQMVLQAYTLYLHTEDNCNSCIDHIIIGLPGLTESTSDVNYNLVTFGMFTNPHTYWTNIQGNHQSLLLLSGDIEENPGPVSEDSENRILEAISSLEYRITSEIKDVKLDITAMKNDISKIKLESYENKQEMIKIKHNQSSLAAEMASVQNEVEQLRDIKESLQLDVEYIHNKIEMQQSKLDDMNQDIDFIEREARKSTIRVFGLEESDQESNWQLKDKVLNKVLKVSCPEEDWQKDDIKHVTRMGKRSDDYSRIVFLTFRFDDDKFKVYKGRDALRKNGIRVSDDLTRRQRAELNKLKRDGKNGYFYKGKLYAYEQMNKSETRVKVKAKRKSSQNTRENIDSTFTENQDNPNGNPHEISSNTSLVSTTMESQEHNI